MANPWKTLKATPEVMLRMERLDDSLGGGCYVPDPVTGLGLIKLDRRLTQRERNAVLAHELWHHERGGGCNDPAADRVECRRIWRLVAEDQVPDDELRVLWVEAERSGRTIGPAEVAERFGTTEEVAVLAMRRLLDRLRAEIDAAG